MKVLRISLIVLGILVAIVAVLAFLAPKDMNLERSIVINAPREVVYQHVKTLTAQNVWSPWTQLDSTMTAEYRGTDGEVGAVYAWQGNSEVGKGEQEITSVTPNERVEQVIRFEEPFASTAAVFIALTDTTDNSTKVSWGFKSKMQIPFNAMGLFFNMTEAIGQDYDKGLNSLKTLVESAPKMNATTGNIQEVEFPVQQLITYRKEIKMSELSSFMQDEMAQFAKLLAEKQAAIAGRPMALTYKWDEANGTTDIALAFPLAKPIDLGSEYKMVSIPAAKAYMMEYYGDYVNTESAHEAISAFLAEKGITSKTPIIEEYITDPAQEPDPKKWLTKIYYFPAK